MALWKIEVKPKAEKQYLTLDKETGQRIKKALRQLELPDDPLSYRNVRPLAGLLKGDYRLRVGDWRIPFTPEKDGQIILVYAILRRGSAY
jgi:mRNA interferase RelE/StbE